MKLVPRQGLYGRLMCSATFGLLGAWMVGAAPASAAEAPPKGPASNAIEEVVVTARRRDEQPIDVPTPVTAFSQKAMDRAGVNNLTDIARLVPQLVIEVNPLGYGGFLTLRGVTSPTANVESESAVLIEVDGMPIGYGGIVKLGQFDLGQVEVLEGPQALYFGKNSVGGIVALKSAEPTDSFDSMARISYETRAREWMGEAYVSGPITSTLRGRLAAKFDDQRGYVENIAPGVRNKWGPGTQEKAVRGTLIFEPNDQFVAKLKGAYSDAHDHGTYFLSQRFFCPSGIPSGASTTPGVTDCKNDDKVVRGDLSPLLAAGSGDSRFRDGVPYSYSKQGYGVLDMTYQLTPSIQLSSLTGHYQVKLGYADQLSRGTIAFTNITGTTKKRIWTEEIRLTSTLPDDSPFSWMAGGYLERNRLEFLEGLTAFTPPATFRNLDARPEFWVKDHTSSAFAQASYAFREGFKLSGGARYTDQVKRQTVSIGPRFIPEVSSKAWSPEVTLSYEPPGHNLNIYTAYKKGFQSGGFQLSSTAFNFNNAVDNSYKKESVEGYEIGAKAFFLDRTLRINANAYNYKFSDLQLSTFNPIILASVISNAAASRVKGVVVDGTYAPPQAPGLQLSAHVAYNRARYIDFQNDCYVGQTIAEGCTLLINGRKSQDLSGRPLPRAPKWGSSLHASYERDVGDNLVARVDVGAQYQSFSYLSQETIEELSRPGGWLVDATASIGAKSGAWELAVIAKDLNGRYYGVSGTQVGGTGNNAFTGTNTPGGHADLASVITSRGPEYWLRLTVHPNLLN